MVDREADKSREDGKFQLDLIDSRRREFIVHMNGRLKTARERLAADNLEKSGRIACEQYALDMDEILREVCDWLVAESQLATEDYCRIDIVAQGGYGRGQLNYYSDIDLLIIMPDCPMPVEHAFIKSFLHVLWDLNKVELGHATKKIGEALLCVGTDLEATTSLIETRLIAGQGLALTELRRKFSALVRGSGRKWFLESKLEQQRLRHEKYGSSIYLLEPNVKEGEGGLRDVHSLRWISCVLLETTDLQVLIHKEILARQELQAIETAVDFILKARNVLHELEGRKMDVLNFDRQAGVAQILGYTSDAQLLSEERLMKDYYLHAHNINRFGLKATRILTYRARSVIGGVLSAMQRRSIDENYYVKSGVMFLKEPSAAFFKEDPARVLECFDTAALSEVFLSEELSDLISAAHPVTDTEEFRTSPRCRGIFMRLLGRKRCLAQNAHSMHSTGVLADYMPEFRKLFCLVRIDYYHRYTVDEHLIKTIEVSESIINEDAEHRPEIIEVAKEIKRWDLLNLSLLLHDIAKGEGHGHVLRGGMISQKMTQRMGLPPEEQEVVRQLILLHLKMTHVSQRRDLDDPNVIREMAKAVPDPELLRMLYILTYCDIKAVGPSAWTDWKGTLLHTLYTKTMLLLKGENPVKVIDEKLYARLTEKVLAKAGEGVTRQEVEQFLSNAPRKYLRSMSSSRMARHLRMLKQVTPENRIIWELDEPRMNYTEVTAVSYDVKGFMSNVCGALASKDVNILSVQAFSTKDGFAIDIFQVTDLRGNKLPQGFRMDRLRNDLNCVLLGQANASEVFTVRKQKKAIRSHVARVKPPEILVDNDSSPSFTIIEVKTYDRPGLLYDMTRTFTECGYDIDLAMITTEAYRVVDVFYITDYEFNKLEANQVKKLQAALENAISIRPVTAQH